MASTNTFLLLLVLLSSTLTLPTQSANNDQPPPPSTCEASASHGCYDKPYSTQLKVIAIFTILVSSMIGIGLPMFSNSFPALNPDTITFVLIKALASGVILSTGFMHVLPDSWNNLTSECLPESPWQQFPISTFVTMVTAVFTMMMDSMATSWFQRRGVSGGATPTPTLPHCCGHRGGVGGSSVDSGAVHSHASPVLDQTSEVVVSVTGGGKEEEKSTQLLRYRIVAQVLEMGIVVHSVVIGLSMGVSNNPCTIRPLVAAMCFHQLFEGMGLGGCILQAEYKFRMKFTLATFFSITTPFGIALGMGLVNVYDENSPTALIVVGVLNAISAGLLIYMALVNLLASDFMSPRLQSSIKLQLQGYVAVCIGMGCMSLMAKWA